MDKEVQILYTELSQDDQDKVDTMIRELFSKRQSLLEIKDCPNVGQQGSCL